LKSNDERKGVSVKTIFIRKNSSFKFKVYLNYTHNL